MDLHEIRVKFEIILGYLVVAMYEMDGKPDHFAGIFSDPSDGQVIDCVMPDTHVKSQVY